MSNNFSYIFKFLVYILSFFLFNIKVWHILDFLLKENKISIA